MSLDMERASFDNQIFTWENWVPEGPMSMQFINVELVVQVGNFPVGTKFPFAFLLGDISVMVLVDEEQQEHTFELKLSVGNPVELPACEDEGCTHHH